MINEERLAEVQECFKADGTDGERLEKAVAVILYSVDDHPVELQADAVFPATTKKVTDRLTKGEATLIAEMVQINMRERAEVERITEAASRLNDELASMQGERDHFIVFKDQLQKELTKTQDMLTRVNGRLEDSVQLSSEILRGFQAQLDDDMDEVENCNWLADKAGIPLRAASAIYQHIRWLEQVGSHNGQEIQERERDIARITLAQAKEASDQAEARAWEHGEIQRQMSLAWQNRTRKLRLALVQLAEAPNVCEQCKGSLLAPAPHPDEILNGLKKQV